MESHESFARVTAIPTTISSNAAANAPTPTRNPKSEEERTISGDLDAIERRLLEHDDGGRQRRVAEIRSVFLPVCERPSQEVHHRFSGGLVLRILVEQKPGEGRNRI